MQIQMFVGASALGAPFVPPPHPADRVIAVDGGVTLVPADLRVDLLVGDFDSLPETFELDDGSRAARVEHLPRDKDVTDFEAALALALAEGPSGIHVVNGIGERLDHLVALLAMLECIPSHVTVTAQIGDRAVHRLTATAPFAARLELGSLLSIIPCSSGLGSVTTAGLRWQLCGESLAHGTGRGLSNEVVLPHIQITAGTGAAFVITTLPSVRTVS